MVVVCTRIGEEISFQYDVIPAKFQVIENVKFKYGCSNPQCDQPPKTARQNPPPPLPRTQASPGVLDWIGASKFVDGLPLNRIAAIAEKRFGVPFTSTPLADWMIKGAERIISPLVVAMEKALYGYDYLHIDETTLQVLNEAGRSAKQKSYIWCRVTVGKEAPIVHMHYSPSRAGAVASKLLEDSVAICRPTVIRVTTPQPHAPVLPNWVVGLIISRPVLSGVRDSCCGMTRRDGTFPST